MSCLLVVRAGKAAGVVPMEGNLRGRASAVIGRPADEPERPRPMVAAGMTYGVVRSTEALGASGRHPALAPIRCQMLAF
jgi:hypothetical protein